MPLRLPRLTELNNTGLAYFVFHVHLSRKPRRRKAASTGETVWNMAYAELTSTTPRSFSRSTARFRNMAGSTTLTGPIETGMSVARNEKLHLVSHQVIP